MEYLWIAILIVAFSVWGIFAIKDLYKCTHSVILSFKNINLSTILFLAAVTMLFAYSLAYFILLRG